MYHHLYPDLNWVIRKPRNPSQPWLGWIANDAANGTLAAWSASCASERSWALAADLWKIQSWWLVSTCLNARILSYAFVCCHLPKPMGTHGATRNWNEVIPTHLLDFLGWDIGGTRSWHGPAPLASQLHLPAASSSLLTFWVLDWSCLNLP